MEEIFEIAQVYLLKLDLDITKLRLQKELLDDADKKVVEKMIDYLMERK